MSSALAPMTREEIVRGLVAAGVPRDKAEAQAARARTSATDRRVPPGMAYVLDEDVVRPERPERGKGGDSVRSANPSRSTGPDTSSPDPAVITWPLQLTLPWSHLATDNRKHGAIIRPVGANRTPTPLLVMAAEYREAKTKIRKLARSVLSGAEPVSIPLQLVARVWIPDTTRKHDVVNFAKCTHDALQEAVYTDDTWLYDARWIRAGVDVDRPRAEITITPLPL